MWYKRSHLLQPLSSLTSKKVQFKWTFVKQKALDEIKRIFARDTLLIYPYFNNIFYIQKDASEFQIVSVICQTGKPIAFYSCKLTKTQQRYTVPENELLSIVETLKEFCTIILGQQLKIYTYNINLTCKKIQHW